MVSVWAIGPVFLFGMATMRESLAKMSLLSTSFTRSDSSLGYSGVDRAFEVSCNSEDQLKRSALG